MAPYISLTPRAAVAHNSAFSQGNALSERSASSSQNGPFHKHNYNPGLGTKPPQEFNNKAYFALFALLGAAMVVTSIWFFFWAKNGGFVWRKNDWDDYKSTVLRRKGPDGKTLTNATPATDLGEKSIAGTFDVERDRAFDEKRHWRGAGATKQNNARHHTQYTQRQQGQQQRRSSRPADHRRREPSDDDLKAYRHEKPARVGGLNRQSDGSHFDFSSTEPSEVVSNNSAEYLRPKPAPARKKGFLEKQREKKQEKKAEKKMKQDKKIDKKKQAKRGKDASNSSSSHAAPTTQSRPRHKFAADEASSVGNSSHIYSNKGSSHQDSYFASYRPPAPPHAASRRHETARQSSPPKQARPLPRHPGAFDGYSEAGSSDTGTKVYTHHIPELSRGSRDPGFRRGGVRLARRDSLSDSDDGDLAARRR